MKKSKFLSVLACILMLLNLVACGNFSDENDKNSQKSIATENINHNENSKKDTKSEATVNESFLDDELRIDYPRPTGNPALRKGAESKEVGWFQIVLNRVLQKSDKVDCKFGSGTQANVKKFQSIAGLRADGVARPKAIEKLVAIATGQEDLTVITTTKVTTTAIPATTTERTTTAKPSTYSVEKEDNDYTLLLAALAEDMYAI